MIVHEEILLCIIEESSRLTVFLWHYINMVMFEGTRNVKETAVA